MTDTDRVLTGRYVAVIGPGGTVADADRDAAFEVASQLAELGAVIITGGLDGIMKAAAEGARARRGTSVGLLPGTDRGDGSDAHTVLIPTGLGELRNGLVVRSADAVIAIGGSWGTLSEIALAVRTGVPLVRTNGWDLPEGAGIEADGPDDVVRAVVSVLQVPDVDQADRGPRVVGDDGA